MSEITLIALVPVALMLVSGGVFWWLSSLRPRQPSPGQLHALHAVRVLALVVFVASLFAVLGFAANFGFALIWIVAGVVLMACVHQYRQAERKSLLQVLATAVDRGIPLEVAARAFAEERQGKTGIRAANLAEYLEAGLPMSLALKRSGHPLPPAVFLAAELGQQTGSVGPALRQVVRQMDVLESTLHAALEKLFYLGFLVLYGLLVLAFMMIKIVPVFTKLMEEFEMELPKLTQVLIEISNFLVRGWFLALPIVLLIGFLVILGLLNYVGYSPRSLPGVSWWWYRADTSLIMRWLAVATRQKRSLAEFIRLLAGYFPTAPIQNRLARAAKRIDKGMSWQDSLYRAGLIRRSDSRVFQAAERAGNLDWALDEMADSTLRRAEIRTRAMLQVVLPVLLVILGFCVLCFAVGMLLPLFSLIMGLA